MSSRDNPAEHNPEALARSLNVLRTRYTTSQRAIFVAPRANLTKADAARKRLLGVHLTAA